METKMEVEVFIKDRKNDAVQPTKTNTETKTNTNTKTNTRNETRPKTLRSSSTRSLPHELMKVGIPNPPAFIIIHVLPLGIPRGNKLYSQNK